MSTTRKGRHPMQPIALDKHGVARFKTNKIVIDLLDTHPTVDMNTLAMGDYSRADRNQFAQLIGYSVDGFAELQYSYPSDIKDADDFVINKLKNKGWRRHK